jgi:hypothetical protein
MVYLKYDFNSTEQNNYQTEAYINIQETTSYFIIVKQKNKEAHDSCIMNNELT